MPHCLRFVVLMLMLLGIMRASVSDLKGQSCHQYLMYLGQLIANNKTKESEVTLNYTLYSGKIADDLGFPMSCDENHKNEYYTAEFNLIDQEDTQFRLYYGLCFTAKCNVDELNQNSDFILNKLLDLHVDIAKGSLRFVHSNLHASLSVMGWIALIGLLSVIGFAFAASAKRFYRNCKHEIEDDEEERSLQNKYNIQFTEDYDPTLLEVHQSTSLVDKFSVTDKLSFVFKDEENDKVLAFSSFKIMSTPLILYGYLFYLCNRGSYNYFSFNQQIYGELFAKVALLAYYLPDGFLFISGYLLGKRAFLFANNKETAVSNLLKVVKSKFMKMYPLYLLVVFIYWTISGDLHGGPVWFVYEEEVARCNSDWWRVFLLIDNWFVEGCYDWAWFVHVEIQLTALATAFFLIYYHSKKLGLVVLAILTITVGVLSLTISGPLPVSIETMLSDKTMEYFKSTYSHAPYFLFGVINAHVGGKQSFYSIFERVAKNRAFNVSCFLLSASIIILVTLRPGIWENVLGFELGLTRLGFFVALYLMMFRSMFFSRIHKTKIHKLSNLTFGIILISGMVVSSYFWSGGSFPYLDNEYLFESLFANWIICAIVGGFLTVLMWPKGGKKEEDEEINF